MSNKLITMTINSGTQYSDEYFIDEREGFAIEMYGQAGTFEIEVSLTGLVWDRINGHDIIIDDNTVGSGRIIDIDNTRAKRVRINKVNAGTMDGNLIAKLKLQ